MDQSKFQFDFKPEIRKQGEDLVAKDAVFLPAIGDVRVEGLVRGSQSAKVSLSSKSVSDSLLIAKCNCVKFAKGQFCKHIWSVMIAVDQKYPDFLEMKSEIERAVVEVAPDTATSSSGRPRVSDAMNAAREAAKSKQSEYRKAQYAKQKARLKEQKLEKKSEKKDAARAARTADDQKGSKRSAPQAVLSDEVSEALAFFSVSGFDFEYPVAIESLRSAKKILSRIFHPDKGGTHEEMLEMNRHFDALAE